MEPAVFLFLLLVVVPLLLLSRAVYGHAAVLPPTPTGSIKQLTNFVHHSSAATSALYNKVTTQLKERMMSAMTLEETLYTPEELILQSGYAVEVKNVWSDDGFLLGLHHILPETQEPLGVVLMVHGLFMNAGCWVANLPNNDLAFMLHDAGFDVWLGNFRGTKYSSENSHLTTKDKDYWEWSFTEQGQLDLPAMTNFILNETGFEQLTLIGHSEGGSASLMALSTVPEMREKVGLWVGLAPAVFVQNCASIPFVLMDKLHVADLMYDLHIYHVEGLQSIGDILVGDFCSSLKYFCELPIEFICGWDMQNCNASRVDVYIQQTDSTSTHNLQHGFQCMDSGKFQFFDYGSKENNEKYGQSTPPEIPLSEVDIPIMLYYGGHDIMVDPEDIEQHLIPSLSNAKFVVPPRKVEEWNHADPLWSMNGTYFREITDYMLTYAPRH